MKGKKDMRQLLMLPLAGSVIRLSLLFALYASPVLYGETPGATGGATAMDPLMNPFNFPEEAPVVPDESRFLGEFFYMLLMLSILIGAVFLTSWFLRKMVNTRIEQQNASSSIKILERRALSQKTTLYVVEVEGEVHLIAESPTNVVQLELKKPLTSSDEAS